MTALAESALWTLVATPLTATTGVTSTFTLTATNADPLAPLDSGREIGCVVVDVPGNFAIQSAAVTGASGGGSWSSSVSGNRVRIQASGGGDRLELTNWVRFTVRAMPLSAGQLTWASRAYRDQGCSGTGALLSVPPIVVVTGAAVTPSPIPTPAPTVAPTPAPTPTPRPTAMPSLLPTPPPITLPSLPPITILPTPRPSSPVVTPEPSRPASPAPTSSARTSPDAEATAPPSATPAPTGEPSSTAPDATPGEAGVGPADPPSGGAGIPQGRILAEPPSSDGEAAPVPIALGALGLLGSIDIWIVPGLLLGVPGLLVIAFVVLQAVGALAWIPAIRRLRGHEPEPATA